MRLLILLIAILNVLFAFTQNRQSVVICNQKSNETIIGADIYSFSRCICLSRSNIEGILFVNSVRDDDTIFQIQATGFKHKKIHLSELIESDTVKLIPVESDFTLGSNSIIEFDYENFHRKCVEKDLEGYQNRYIYGRWISNWGSYVGGDSKNEKNATGTIYNIYKDTLVVEYYLFNSQKSFKAFKFEIRNDTIIGKLLEHIDYDLLGGKSKDSFCTQTSDIKIPICELRVDCLEYYTSPNARQGFKKSTKREKSWQDIEVLISNWKPLSERLNIRKGSNDD